jgi:hypothetical protein
MDSSSHPKASSSDTHSSKGYKGRKPFIPQDRSNTYKRNYKDNDYQPRYFQHSTDFSFKQPRLNENPDNNGDKNQFTNPRNNTQRDRSRTSYTPYERPPHVPYGAEMFYQSGRLPTGMYVNRNTNVDNSRKEAFEISSGDDVSNDKNSSQRKEILTSAIPKSHPLIKKINKKHVAVPFLHCSTSEKAPTKEASKTTKTKSIKAATASTTSEPSTMAKPGADSDNDRPTLEEIERTFQKEVENLKKVKQETVDNTNGEIDAQPPSVESREIPHPCSSSNGNQDTDFTSDSSRFNYQFPPAVPCNEYNFPDPSGDKNAKIMALNASMANLRAKKAELMQHSKNLTSTLTRVLTEIEIIDIQIDQTMYKTAALRNQS